MTALTKYAAVGVIALASAAVGWAAGGTYGSSADLSTSADAQADFTAAAHASNRLYAVGDAGTVTLSVNGETLALVSVDAQVGWGFEIEDKGPSSLEIRFDAADGDAVAFSAVAIGNEIRAEMNGAPLREIECGPTGVGDGVDESDDVTAAPDPEADEEPAPDANEQPDPDADEQPDETAPKSKVIEVGAAGTVTFMTDGEGSLTVGSVSPSVGWSFGIVVDGDVHTVVFTDEDGNVHSVTGLFLSGNIVTNLSL